MARSRADGACVGRLVVIGDSKNAETLGVTQRAMVGLWVLTALSIFLAVGMDIGVLSIAAGIALACAVALTAWKLIVRPSRDGHRFLLVDAWLERIMRIPLFFTLRVGLETRASAAWVRKSNLRQWFSVRVNGVVEVSDPNCRQAFGYVE